MFSKPEMVCLPEGSPSPTRDVEIFIGSSSEYGGVAKKVCAVLDSVSWLKAASWEGHFRASKLTMEELERAVRNYRYAAFILGDEDAATIRGQQHSITRDNVWFEAGLFVGKRGRENTFLLYPEDRKPKIPSDLDGITLCGFVRGEDEEAEPKIDQACQSVVEAIQRRETNASLAEYRAVELLENAYDLIQNMPADSEVLKDQRNQAINSLLKNALGEIKLDGQDLAEALGVRMKELLLTGWEAIQGEPGTAMLKSNKELKSAFFEDLIRVLRRAQELARYGEVMSPWFTRQVPSRFLYEAAIDGMRKDLARQPLPILQQEGPNLLARCSRLWAEAHS